MTFVKCHAVLCVHLSLVLYLSPRSMNNVRTVCSVEQLSAALNLLQKRSVIPAFQTCMQKALTDLTSTAGTEAATRSILHDWTERVGTLLSISTALSAGRKNQHVVIVF